MTGFPPPSRLAVIAAVEFVVVFLWLWAFMWLWRRWPAGGPFREALGLALALATILAGAYTVISVGVALGAGS